MAKIIKLKKGLVQFRNPGILNVDTKRITLERVLTALYMHIFSGGAMLKSNFKGEFDIELLKEHIKKNEEAGLFDGAIDNIDAVEDWLRSSLIDLVNRGNVVKEKVASLRPMHLLSFRVQNRRYCRDYNTADHLYMMLRTNLQTLNGLKAYLTKGWDLQTNHFAANAKIDVDTAGILYLSKNLSEKKNVNTTVDNTRPLLEEQTKLFNDDINRLLAYQNVLPRNVFIDYLRILCGLHLALYTFKVVYLLPKMVEAGTTKIEDDWNIVVDVTDNLRSEISQIACDDIARMENTYRQYIHAAYCINTAQMVLERQHKDNSIESALQYLQGDIDQTYFSALIDNICADQDAESLNLIDEIVELFDENDHFGKFICLLESSNLGNSQYRFLREFIDACCMKNSPSMLMADGRSRLHPRRGAIGSKLLETLVQLLVLTPKAGGGYTSRSMSIEELAQAIRDRYGLIINGVNEPRFAQADIATHAAFKENMDAFKDKLRQIGFYTDLSDACILQKIRPRYKFED